MKQPEQGGFNFFMMELQRVFERWNDLARSALTRHLMVWMEY